MNQNLPWQDRLDYSAEEQRTGNRLVLSGEFADDTGGGRFVLVRREQAGFSRTVDFVPDKDGIAAINMQSGSPAGSGEIDQADKGIQRLDYHLSVDPVGQCAVKYLYLSILSDGQFPDNSRLKLTWRGGGNAKFVGHQLPDDDGGATIFQGEEVEIASWISNPIAWKIAIPTNSVSISLTLGEGLEPAECNKIAIIVDAAFSKRIANSKVDVPPPQQVPYKKIPPTQVMQLIEQAESSASEIATDAQTATAEPYGFGDDKVVHLKPDIDPQATNDGANAIGVVTVSSEKIGVFCGEDIILGTAGIFDESLAGAASFISINLPDWLFLDQVSGDIMGTVPLNVDDKDAVEFTVYAVDGNGGSAKAVIVMECYEGAASISSFHDHEILENIPVAIDASQMFSGFGLEIVSLEFSATGLPAGLAINAKSGLISGEARTGSAHDDPYEIVVTGTNQIAGGSGFGMRFLINVNPQSAVEPVSADANLLTALGKLYRANQECEQVLATNLLSSPGDFATNSISSSSHFPQSDHGSQGDIKIAAFTPRRTIYLHLNEIQINQDITGRPTFTARLPGTESLPDWINFTEHGFASIECSPDRQFVDLEIDVVLPDGISHSHDIRLDTFTGEIQHGNKRWISSIEKQLADAVAI